MKIGFVAPRASPAIGGAESFLRDLAQELSLRHDVRVVALSIGDEPPNRLWDSLRAPAPFEPFADGAVDVVPLRISGAAKIALAPLAYQVVPVVRRYAYGRSRLAAAALYEAVVGRLVARSLGDVDVVQVWQAGFLAGAGVRAARLLGVPSVVMSSLHPGVWGDDRASARTYRRANAVLAQLESEACAYRSLGVPAERISVCGAPVRGVARGGGAWIRARYGIRGPLIVFLGNRRPYKGVDVLLAAAAQLRTRVRGVRVAFVGPGPALASDDPCVLDVGSVRDEECAAWLDAADLVCLPSAAESFGLAVVEAWSAGTPVVTSDIPALRELVETSGGGWTARRDPDALAAVLEHALSDPDELVRAGERGRAAWRARFTSDAVARRIESVYASALGHTRTEEAAA
jgi:glycosyltransferase involved in cell wall biosynthesis